MNWLNLHTRIARAPEYVGSEPTQRATWLSVMLYCVEQENGGRIAGAKAWKDRQWQQTCGVTLTEVSSAAPLLVWSEEDLTVWEYPAQKEAEVQAKRNAGKIGGIRSGVSRNEAVLEAETKQTRSTASSSGEAELEALLERKGMEGKENRKENGKTATPLPFSSAEFLAAWVLFTKHRGEIRKPLKPTSASMALKQLSAMGEQRAIRCIEHTIAKGWQGLREPDARDVRQPSLAPEFNKF